MKKWRLSICCALILTGCSVTQKEEKGKYDWSETDIAFTKIYEKGITPFVTLGSGNRFYPELTTYDDPKLAEIYGSRPDPASINLELIDCPFINPVRVDLLSGEVFRIDKFKSDNGKTVFYDLPLTDYPFLLVELKEIDLDK
jgi:hypothetical protein